MACLVCSRKKHTSVSVQVHWGSHTILPFSISAGIINMVSRISMTVLDVSQVVAGDIFPFRICIYAGVSPTGRNPQ